MRRCAHTLTHVLIRAMLKSLQEQNVTISSKTLRKGVVKIGSGTPLKIHTQALVHTSAPSLALSLSLSHTHTHTHTYQAY